MADQQAAQYSEGDVTSLAQKLEQFSQTLAPGEQAALTAVIERAMPQEDDVQGYLKQGVYRVWTIDTFRLMLLPRTKR